MNIETKTVRGDFSEYLFFGWKHTEEIRSERRHHYTEHVLARDLDMPNHKLISALEAKYFRLKSNMQTYHPITETPESFLLLLLFVFPFLIYWIFKANQKEKIQKNNDDLKLQMNNVLKEVRTLI